MFRSGCPTADKLEVFAKRPENGRMEEHVQSCPICHKIIEDLREEAALVDELQRAICDELAPNIRRRLSDLSREAVFNWDQDGECRAYPAEDGEPRKD
ncbi:hypothetical protein RAS2_10080 [Phycisphaerae bacterium RAS2]|nr:hypothetical protein RAS2_10080 [Phycisphaerae bacterium RAS2]